MFYILILITFLLIGLEIYSSKKNKKFSLENKKFQTWYKIYKWRWFIGIIFIPITFISYPMFGTTNTIYGFPLIVAVFDKNGADFIGPTTTPFMLINIVLWYFIIHILLFFYSKILEISNKS